jgi:hypothetical protein
MREIDTIVWLILKLDYKLKIELLLA